MARKKKKKKVDTTRRVQVNLVPSSTSGTEIYGGYYNEDYLELLKNTDQAEVYDKMRRQDPQVKMLLSSVKNPIKSAKYEILPASDEEIDANISYFVEKQLFEMMRTPWTTLISEVLTMIEFGFSVFEEHHKINTEPFYNADGKLLKDKYIQLHDLRYISQKTVERFNFDNDNNWTSITQQAYGDLENQRNVSTDFLNHFVIDMEGQNLQGISMIRSCYGPYFRKQNYLKFNAIGIEKFAIGTPIGSIPEGEEESNATQDFEQALREFSTHQKNYIMKTTEYEVDLKMNTYDPQKVEVSIDNEDKRMTKSFLANFLELGMNGVGSQSLSSDLSTFFLNGIDYISSIIEDMFNRRIIRRIVDLNFPSVKSYPTLKISGISDKSGKDVAEIVSMLTNSGILIPDLPLEEHLRKRFGLTKKSDETNLSLPNSPVPFTEEMTKSLINFRKVMRNADS